MADPAAVQAAIDRLDKHRDALFALAGVVGAGVGMKQGAPTPHDVVIQLFVRAADSVQLEVTKRQASAILGGSEPELIVTGEITAADH
jgi:hypothetical protein